MSPEKILYSIKTLRIYQILSNREESIFSALFCPFKSKIMVSSCQIFIRVFIKSYFPNYALIIINTYF